MAGPGMNSRNFLGPLDIPLGAWYYVPMQAKNATPAALAALLFNASKALADYSTALAALAAADPFTEGPHEGCSEFAPAPSELALAQYELLQAAVQDAWDVAEDAVAAARLSLDAWEQAQDVDEYHARDCAEVAR